MVELLIKNGLNVSTIDFTGLSSAQLAQLADKEDLVKLLISNGVNLSAASDNDGFKLLHWAASQGRNLLTIIFLNSIPLKYLIV